MQGKEYLSKVPIHYIGHSLWHYHYVAAGTTPPMGIGVTSNLIIGLHHYGCNQNKNKL